MPSEPGTAEERMVDNGYFRCRDDLLSAMGLSWSNPVAPMLDEREFLPVSRVAELLALIESHPLTNEGLASGLSPPIRMPSAGDVNC